MNGTVWNIKINSIFNKAIHAGNRFLNIVGSFAVSSYNGCAVIENCKKAVPDISSGIMQHFSVHNKQARRLTRSCVIAVAVNRRNNIYTSVRFGKTDLLGQG